MPDMTQIMLDKMDVHTMENHIVNGIIGKNANDNYKVNDYPLARDVFDYMDTAAIRNLLDCQAVAFIQTALSIDSILDELSDIKHTSPRDIATMNRCKNNLRHLILLMEKAASDYFTFFKN